MEGDWKDPGVTCAIVSGTLWGGCCGSAVLSKQLFSLAIVVHSTASTLLIPDKFKDLPYRISRIYRSR